MKKYSLQNTFLLSILWISVDYQSSIQSLKTYVPPPEVPQPKPVLKKKEKREEKEKKQGQD